MLIACDGLWKCFSPQEAVEKVDRLISENSILQKVISGEVSWSFQIGCNYTRDSTNYLYLQLYKFTATN